MLSNILANRPPPDYALASTTLDAHRKYVANAQHIAEKALSRYAIHGTLEKPAYGVPPRTTLRLCQRCQSAFRDRKTSRLSFLNVHKKIAPKSYQAFLLNCRTYDSKKVETAAKAGCLICDGLQSEVNSRERLADAAAKRELLVCYEIPHELISNDTKDFLHGRLLPDIKLTYYRRFFIKFLKVRGPILLNVVLREVGMGPSSYSACKPFELRLSEGESARLMVD
jgi:hypothetical protein